MISLNSDFKLRKPELDDVNDLFEIKNDDETKKTLVGFSASFSKQDILNWIEYHNKQNNEILFVIEHTPSRKVIGHIGLYNIDYRARKCSCGILIGNKSFRRKGLGYLCLKALVDFGFDNLNLNRIEADFLQDNIASLSIYKKIGFKIEGKQRQAQYKLGMYYDLVLMALLRDERI